MAKTEISFVSGFDGLAPVPTAVVRAGLAHRFAVIQQTYRSDSIDMFFDAPLCRAMVELARELAPQASIKIRDGSEDEYELPADEFLVQFDKADLLNNGPPYLVLARTIHGLVLCIASEEWAAIGGPMPYHDSYIYSVFTRDDAGEKVQRFLAGRAEEAGWMLHSEIRQAKPRPPKARRLLEILRRAPNRAPLRGDELE